MHVSLGHNLGSTNFPKDNELHNSINYPKDNEPHDSPNIAKEPNTSHSVIDKLINATLIDLCLSPSIHSSKPVDPLLQNDLVMLTRAKNDTLKLKVFIAHTETGPTNIKQALAKLGWIQVMQAEYDDLITNETWTFTILLLLKHIKIVGCRWVLKIKENFDGNIYKYNATLIAKS